VSIERLVGIYDADGTVRGELAYLLGRARGTAHCALCDITHGRLRRRADFDEASEQLTVTLELRHRDEIDETVRLAADGRFPCVVAVGTEGAWVVMDRDDLDACEGDPAALVERLNAAV
jgi:uncharacterized cupin superfamily protein